MAIDLTYVTTAALAALLWDILLTLGVEVQHIWPSKFSVIKAIWIWNRFAIPSFFVATLWVKDTGAFQQNNTICFAWSFVAGIVYITTCAATNWIFVLRVLALFGSKRLVGTLIRASFVMVYLAEAIVTLQGWFTVRSAISWVPFLKMCIFTDDRPLRIFVLIFILTGVFDVLVFCLTVYKTLRIQKHLGWDSRSVIGVLFRDGVLWFAVIIVFRIINIVVLASDYIIYFYGTWFASWTLTSLLFSRIFLSMKLVTTQPNRRLVISIESSESREDIPLHLLRSDSTD